MTSFVFEAARLDGHRIKGSVEAPTQSAAAAIVSARGLLPLQIHEPRVFPLLPFRRASTRSLATLFESLSAVVEAGIPLEKALTSSLPVVSGSLRDATLRLSERVREGSSLAAALAAEGPRFPSLTVGLVRAGERGAGLGSALRQAANQLTQASETRSRIQAALAYPALLAVVGLTSVGIIIGVVVPRFVAILGDLGQSTPFATRALITVSELVRQNALFLAVVSVAFVGVAVRELGRNRARWHARLLKVPTIGSIRHSLASARACSTLSTLLGTGVPALTSLAIARDAVGDEAIALRIARARDLVGEGHSFTSACDVSGVLTPLALQLARIGESSGRLADLLGRAAELDARTAERKIKVLVTLLEPTLILIFAALVAFVAAALLQAVYSVRPGGM